MKQPIPLSVIDAANNSGQFATLRVWVLLKKIKGHNIICKLSYSELQAITGISHTCLRKHVIVMVSNGWATRTDAGHLHLTGINKLKRHDKETCIPVPVEETKQAQILQFRNVLLHRNIKSQEKRIKQKANIVNNCNRPHGKLSKAQLSAVNKAGGVKKFESSLQPVTTLTNKSIGSLYAKFNGQPFSKSTGQRIQKALRTAKLITTKVRLELFKANATAFDALYLNNRCGGGYIFNLANGCVYRRLSNAIAVGCN